MNDQALVVHQGSSIVDYAIAAWLDSKTHKSGSSHTAKAYSTTIATFRAYALQAGVDLDGDTDALSLVAQRWINSQKLAPASKHQKLTIVSSFYKYANDRRMLAGNPVKSDLRVKVQSYARVSVIANVADKLAAIDRSYLDGVRDYALLFVTLMTGRRLSEIAALTIGDLALNGDELTITFNRTKGNKTARNIFTIEEMTPLLDYLNDQYDLDTVAKDTPLWISYSRNSSKGNALSVRSLENICQKHMGTNFHTLRHTFAKELESAGAKVSDIQAHLGHSSLATTGLYLAALNTGRNDKSSALAKKFIK